MLAIRLPTRRATRASFLRPQHAQPWAWPPGFAPSEATFDLFGATALTKDSVSPCPWNPDNNFKRRRRLAREGGWHSVRFQPMHPSCYAIEVGAKLPGAATLLSYPKDRIYNSYKPFMLWQRIRAT